MINSPTHSPALRIIEVDVNRSTPEALKFVAVCLDSHLQQESHTAMPESARHYPRSKDKTKSRWRRLPSCPNGSVERLGRYEEGTALLSVAVNGLERLTVPELFSRLVGVTNLQPRE
jgi:hypothetical protein